MDTIDECCTDAVASSDRSIDRLILNACIPMPRTPAAMAVFFRKAYRRPILAGNVFKELNDRFVTQVTRFVNRKSIADIPNCLADAGGRAHADDDRRYRNRRMLPMEHDPSLSRVAFRPIGRPGRCDTLA